MKICLVLDSFFPDTHAGTEQYVLWLAKYLKHEGYEISIVAATTTNIAEYNHEGIPVYRFLVPKEPIAKELNGLIPPRGIEGFEILLKKLKPDIVHFHSFSRAINGFHLVVAKKLGCKTVFTAHLGSLFCIKGNFLLFGKEICDGKVLQSRCMQCYLSAKLDNSNTLKLKLSAGLINMGVHSLFQKLLPPAWHMVKHRQRELEKLNQSCDAIIAIAPWIEKVFKINGLNSIKLVKQGISTIENIGKPLPNQESGIRNQKFPIKLIFVGRLHPMKGLHLLLESLMMLNTEKFHLTIVGMQHDETYRKQMFQKAENMGGVFWKENLPHEEVLIEISKADILVQPAISNEMAPLVILEAYAYGKPVIGSTYPAISDMVVEGKDGLLFETNNTFSLTNCLQRLLDEPDLLPYLKSNVVPSRSFNEVAEEMVGIYKQIVLR